MTRRPRVRTLLLVRSPDAAFLLQLFWGLGLTNRSRILSQGPMMRYGRERVGRFASTGGWSLGTRPVDEIYGSTLLVALTEAQSRRLERVARGVYRPCCDNSTYFPDCNHGMAMLGMLTLLAAADAGEARMFETAVAFSAFWYPEQYRQLARWFEVTEEKAIDEVEPERLVARQVASGTGFRRVRRALAEADRLAPDGRAAVSAC